MWGFLVPQKFDAAASLREAARLRRYAATMPLPKSDNDLAPSIVQCGRRLAFGSSSAEVRVQGDRSWYANVVHCKRPWDCPVCSYRLSQLRSRGLRRLNDVAMGLGYRVLMVTFTFSHHKGSALLDLRSAFSAALEKMRTTRAWSALRSRHGVVGFVRGQEVTYSDANGWHPHCHELWYVSGDVDVSELRRDVQSAYLAALAKVGLSASAGRGVDVVESDTQIAQYVAKFGRFPRWDASKEVSAGRRKGGGKGATPWQLLARASEGDKAAYALFVEYAQAYKGVRQLYVSRGLVELLIGPDVPFAELVSPEDLLDSDGEPLLRGEDGQPLPPAYTVAVKLTQVELNCIFRLGLDGDLLAFALDHPPDDCRAFVDAAVARVAEMSKRGGGCMSAVPHWCTLSRFDYDGREARGLARRYVRDRLGVEPSLVRAYPNGDLRVYVRPGVRLWGFFTREPVAFDDYYIDVHICWSLPCAGCGRAPALTSLRGQQRL